MPHQTSTVYSSSSSGIVDRLQSFDQAIPWLATPPSRLCVSPVSDVAETSQAAGHSREDVLPGTGLQDGRAARHAVYHGPLHQLRHRHDAELGRALRALGAPRRGAALPAKCLVSNTLTHHWERWN